MNTKCKIYCMINQAMNLICRQKNQTIYNLQIYKSCTFISRCQNYIGKKKMNAKQRNHSRTGQTGRWIKGVKCQNFFLWSYWGLPSWRTYFQVLTAITISNWGLCMSVVCGRLVAVILFWILKKKRTSKQLRRVQQWLGELETELPKSTFTLFWSLGEVVS